MYYLGVDLGGTNIAVGLLNEKYEIIERVGAPTHRERPAEAILKDIAMLCKEIIQKAGISEKEVHSIGIGSPGLASPKEGKIISASNLNFTDVNVREEIQKYIDLPVYVENDANCAALGEAICGAAKGEKEVLVVTLGTGVGGGIIIDGKIYSGSFFGAGEIGHHIITFEGGEPCGCGRTGCWEQYASATALIRQAKRVAEKNPSTQMISLAKEGKLENINAKNVFDAAQAGDLVAQQVLDQYFKYIAYGVANLINILQPKMVVLGGGMSAQKEKLTDPVTTYVKKQMYGGVALKTEIKAATLGNDAGIIGAALVGKSLE